jgi:DNA-binding transcriptional LysR family regulator
MSLILLRSFLEVYRQRSLTAAARALSLTQPALSGHMASLETILGRRLFERSRRGVTALGAADELYAALGDSIDRAETVLAGLRARASGLSGVVRIAGPAEYIGEQFATNLQRLTESGLELRISTGNRDSIYAALLEGDVDLAVTASSPDNKKLGFDIVGDERFIAIAPNTLPVPISPEAFVGNAPYCAYDMDLPLIREWCRANGVNTPLASPTVVIPDLRSLLGFVAAGAGWSVLPDYICAAAIANRLVKHIFPGHVQPTNRLYLVWAKGHLRHPRVAYAQQLLSENADIQMR